MPWKPKPTTIKQPRPSWREDAARRGTPAERGYDERWRRYSESFRKEHPICESKCADRGIVTPSDDVHHIKPLAIYPELKYVDSTCSLSAVPAIAY
jgi:hypothetical protein